MDKRMLTAQNGSPFFEVVALRAQLLATHEGLGELFSGVPESITQKAEFKFKRYVQLLASELATADLRVSFLTCIISLFQMTSILNTVQASLNVIFMYGRGACDWKRSQL